MNSLDTNTVLRFLLDDIPAKTAKARLIITKDNCYVTDVVVTETIFVLERVISLGRRDIAKLVQKFLDLPNMTYNDYLLVPAIDLYQNKPSLSFADCYAVIESSVYGNKLITFDKGLASKLAAMR